MSTLGKILGLGNAMLRPAKLSLQSLDRDLDSRLLSPAHIERMLAAIAAEADEYLQSSMPFPRGDTDSIRDDVPRFYETYLNLPIRGQGGGSRFVNLLWLFAISKTFRPELIVESGTFMGLSSWALRQGNADARIHSFDIDLGNLRQRCDASYHEHDWSEFDFGQVDPQRSLCYFDDHVDQINRVLEAHQRGFKYLVFDDDLSVGRMPVATGSPISLPKLQFAYDDGLKDGEEIRWVNGRHTSSYTVDREYLDRGRKCIESIQKLPDLSSSVSVVWQNPYTLVVLK